MTSSARALRAIGSNFGAPTHGSTGHNRHIGRVLACVAAAGLVAIGCRAPIEANPASDASDRQLTVDEFRNLIAEGALKPVVAMGNDDAFKDPHPDKGPDEFDAAAAKVMAKQAAKEEAAGAAPPKTAAADPAKPASAEATQNAAHPVQGAPGAHAPSTGETAAAPNAGAAPSAETAGHAPPANAPTTGATANTPTAGADAAPKPPAPATNSAADTTAAMTSAAELTPSSAHAVSSEPQENPYLVFGKRILVYPSGLIMKPYPLRVGSGAKFQKLIETYGNFPLYKEGLQKTDQVRLELLEGWDQEQFGDLRQNLPKDEYTVMTKIADWLVVTADAERLKEVEGFINVFAAGVPQIEIEAKIVEVTTTDTLDLGVKPINATTPIFGFPDHTFVRSLDYSLPNTASAANSLLALSAVQDGVSFNAILQMLQTYDNVSIISRPKIAVREGGIGRIVNTLKLPSYNVNAITPDGKVSAGLTYEEVGIKLYVVPRVVGTQTVALNIDVEASQQSGSATTFTLGDNRVIANPIISKRAAQTVVYLEPGQAVILGGLVSERTVDTENKVPILGSIPIINYFFKSTFKRKEQANVLFFIRPRILTGSDMNREF